MHFIQARGPVSRSFFLLFDLSHVHGSTLFLWLLAFLLSRLYHLTPTVVLALGQACLPEEAIPTSRKEVFSILPPTVSEMASSPESIPSSPVSANAPSFPAGPLSISPLSESSAAPAQTPAQPAVAKSKSSSTPPFSLSKSALMLNPPSRVRKKHTNSPPVAPRSAVAKPSSPSPFSPSKSALMLNLQVDMKNSPSKGMMLVNLFILIGMIIGIVLLTLFLLR